MPKSVRLGNTILSSVLHSTEYLHYSLFLVEGRQPGGRPIDAHFLCPTWECTFGSRANGSLLSPSWRLYPFNTVFGLELLCGKPFPLIKRMAFGFDWNKFTEVGWSERTSASCNDCVWCFCNKSGKSERGLSAGWGAMRRNERGMKDGAHSAPIPGWAITSMTS